MVDFTSIQSFPVPEKITELSIQNNGLISKNKSLVTGLVILVVLATVVIINQQKKVSILKSKER